MEADLKRVLNLAPEEAEKRRREIGETEVLRTHILDLMA